LSLYSSKCKNHLSISLYDQLTSKQAQLKTIIRKNKEIYEIVDTNNLKTNKIIQELNNYNVKIYIDPDPKTNNSSYSVSLSNLKYFYLPNNIDNSWDSNLLEAVLREKLKIKKTEIENNLAQLNEIEKSFKEAEKSIKDAGIIFSRLNSPNTLDLLVTPDRQSKNINRYAYYLKKFYDTDLIIKKIENDNSSAHFNPATNQIVLNYKTALRDHNLLKHTVLHEARHAQFNFKNNSLLRTIIRNPTTGSDGVPYDSFLLLEELYTHVEALYHSFNSNLKLDKNRFLVFQVFVNRLADRLTLFGKNILDYEHHKSLKLSQPPSIGSTLKIYTEKSFHHHLYIRKNNSNSSNPEILEFFVPTNSNINKVIRSLTELTSELQLNNNLLLKKKNSQQIKELLRKSYTFVRNFR